MQDSSHGDGLQFKLHVIIKTCLAYKFRWPLFIIMEPCRDLLTVL